MLYLSQMTSDMTSLFETLSVTHDQGYDNANRCFFLSQMTKDTTRPTDTLSVTTE